MSTTYSTADKYDIPESLLNRIRKVQALTNSPNLGEASNATAKLSELLFKYNLELADLTSTDDGLIDTSYITEHFATSNSKRAINWKRVLVFRVARYNFCRALTYTSSSKMAIVGQKHNIEFVKWLCNKLFDELPRLAEIGWLYYQLECNANGVKPELHGKSWKNDFLHGACNVIQDRLYKQFKESQNANAESTALVVQSKRKVNDAFNQVFPQTSNVSFNTGNYSSGRVKGKTAGAKVGLNQPIKSGNTRKELQ
jgi:hypothetical protein